MPSVQHSAPILTQPLFPPRHDPGGRETADPAAHHGKHGAEELRRHTRFELAELRAAHEEHHVDAGHAAAQLVRRSEEHTSELQSHSFISYAVFCLTKKPHPRNSQAGPWATPGRAGSSRRGAP